MATTKITEFTRPVIKMLRADIDSALAAVAKEHGIALRVGNIRLDSLSATIKLEAAVVPDAANGKKGKVGNAVLDPAIVRAEADWASHAKLSGLKLKWLGKKFTQRASTFTIRGFLPSRPRNPVLVTNAAGKKFIFSVSSIASLMAD